MSITSGNQKQPTRLHVVMQCATVAGACASAYWILQMWQNQKGLIRQCSCAHIPQALQINGGWWQLFVHVGSGSVIEVEKVSEDSSRGT